MTITVTCPHCGKPVTITIKPDYGPPMEFKGQEVKHGKR